jgi:hypothetical protein
VVIAALGGVAARLMQSHAENRHIYFALEYSLIILAVVWLRSLERRLLDAGLPRWSFWPYFLFVFTACFGAHAHRVDGPRTLALFVVLQIPAFLLQSKPAGGESLPGGARQEAARSYPKYLRPVGPYLFLLRLLLIAAFGAALLNLVQRTGRSVAWGEFCLALVILGFVWIYNVEGRMFDAQLPSWASAAYCVMVPGACFLPLLLHDLGLHAALALFVVLQIPTVFLPSKPMLAQPASPTRKPARQIEPLGALEFAVYLVLIAGLLAVLHLLRGDAGHGAWSWLVDIALDAGSLSLCLAWIACVKKRLKSLGLTHWHIEFCSVSLALCLLPVAFRVMSFTYALLLFVVLQTPVVFIRREWIPASFSPADTDS